MMHMLLGGVGYGSMSFRVRTEGLSEEMLFKKHKWRK